MTYLRLEGITKRFGSFVANDAISLSIQPGTIHALLGENGAGKSTLMNILSGLYRPDGGQIFLQERPVQIHSPGAAIEQGIGMIHQHFMLVPQLTVTENIILGLNKGLRLDLAREGQVIRQMSEAYGLAVDPAATIADLPVGSQQRVEILKALYRNAKLLILDEPTAVLTPPEVEVLIRILRQLAEADHTIIFISHKLDEVMALCDTVTVLRRGKVVATTTTQDTNQQELAQLMVGREVLFNLHKSLPAQESVVLDVSEIQVQDGRGLPAVKGVSFQIKAGEILGVAGVDGNGQRELADAVTGLCKVASGRIRLCDQDVTDWSTQERVKRLKVGYIPEDRQKMGLVMDFSIARNLILKLFNTIPFCRRFLLQNQTIRATADAAIQKYDVRATHSDLKVKQLSGGNQQKVVLARELAGDPVLIVAMQPTRGLDIGATEYVQQRLIDERERGAAILYISTELEEIMAMSDRIAVMYGGQLLAILDAATATVEQVGLLMAGQRQQPDPDRQLLPTEG